MQRISTYIGQYGIMRKLLRCLFLLMPITGMSSCDPCGNLDCAGNNFTGQFRILSKDSNKDMIFGKDVIYNKNGILFFRLTGADTSFFTTELLYFPNTDYDSILVCNFTPRSDTVYMQLQPGDIDTMVMRYETNGSKCCGTITNIVNFRFNNTIDIPGNQGTQVIRK